MSTSLAFRFLAGRYHATPYGHHVNEGLIEWPPSPWRLLRALISVGYTSGEWNGEGMPEVSRRLIEKLSAQLPHYYIPTAVGAHSRHYMPIGGLNSEKIEKTTLVFDTWARVEDHELIVNWNNVRLNEDELSNLGTLVGCLNYLGRAESWVEGRVVGASEESESRSNCFPEQHGEVLVRGWEQISLLAPTKASDFAAWRNESLNRVLAGLPIPEGKRSPKVLLNKRDKATKPYPADLIDCLQKDTTWLRSHGWSQPPGSRRVLYWRPSSAISVGVPRVRRATRPERRVQSMLLSMTNASRNDHALPPVTRTLPQAELLHRALVGIATSRNEEVPTELTGRDNTGKRLGGPHRHAHVNPLDLDDDGHLDHILIWASMGLGTTAQAAIRSLRKTPTKGSAELLRLALAATGDDWRDLLQLPEPYGQHIAHLTSPCKIWESLTPFVPPRYIKARGKNTLEGQVLAELDSRGFPEPVAVHQLAPILRNRRDSATTSGFVSRRGDMPWSRFRHFKLVRQRGPEPPISCGYSIRLEFPCPVPGPVALGYGSHFGLGLFKSEVLDRVVP